MSFLQCFRLALKAIWSSKIRSLLTMLGIIIGVSAVITIVGLGNGMEIYMTDSFASMGTTTLNVSIMGRGSSRSISDEQIYQIVEENPSILDAVTPTVSVNGNVKIDRETLSYTTVTGVGEDYLRIKDYTVAQGRGIEYVDILRRQKVCVIGSYLARTYFNGDALGQTIKISGNPYTVVGVLDEIADSTDEYSTDNLILIPYSNAAKMSFMGTISSYTFNAVDEESVTAAKYAIEDALYDVYQDEDAYTVIAMSELLDMMTSMLNIMITILASIAAISLVVGGIGIMNIMLVSVSERTREIGIRKSLGARKWDILMQFIIEAGTTSAIGGVLGIGMGYLFSSAATALIVALLGENLSVVPTIGSVAMAFGISVAIGVLFGFLPARKAAKLNPIDALHYD
ncbi:MAG: ABC transporter permease [Candidatus Merdivicinus sp.]|jgi:putative ABC transport system permease protein